MTTVPVVYEVDNDTREATGAILFFCNAEHRAEALRNGNADIYAARREGNQPLVDLADGTVCDWCGIPVNPQTAKGVIGGQWRWVI